MYCAILKSHKYCVQYKECLTTLKPNRAKIAKKLYSKVELFAKYKMHKFYFYLNFFRILFQSVSNGQRYRCN